MSLETIYKQSSDGPNAGEQADNDSDGRQTAANRLPRVDVIPSKPLLWCYTLRACIRVRLIKKKNITYSRDT